VEWRRQLRVERRVHISTSDAILAHTYHGLSPWRARANLAKRSNIVSWPSIANMMLGLVGGPEAQGILFGCCVRLNAELR
jgi:hypothetical protein